MQAMILAAGFGTRLLPHTLIKPKPLFPILNQPLLLATIRRLQRLGFDHILVNAHYLAEQIYDALAGERGVILIQEKTILGTGGGLRNALPFMRNEPLLVTNGDIYHMIDFVQVYDEHLRSGQQASLVLHDYPRFNTVLCQNDKIVNFRVAADARSCAFTGVHIINPDILEPIALGTSSCILERYTQMICENTPPTAVFAPKGCYWTDMGTPEDYLKVHEGLIKGSVPRWEELTRPQSPFMIDLRAVLAEDTRLDDWAVLGAVRCDAEVSLRGVVVWDGVHISANQQLSNCIVSSSPN